MRSLLIDLYRAAVNAAMPGPALRAALRCDPPPSTGRIWIAALGKAALPMAEAAVAELAERGRAPAGGLVVPPEPAPSPHPALQVAPGDHPEPGPRSLAAAERLADLAARVAPGDEAWVLLSGGTTSLVGAPDHGIPDADLTALYALLLRSGLDIGAMNRVRKRFTRWGGGRLARALGQAARIRTYVVSDVIGDDLAAIGSGPCVPDPTSAADVRRLLAHAGLLDRLPASLKRILDATESAAMPETPKPGDPVFARVDVELIASNRLAREAAARRAAELGLAPQIVDTPLAGEASMAGASVAATILNYAPDAGAQQGPRPCTIWGGETTVTITGEAGLGGRSQELALAAARTLAGAPPGVALLAAGTDGRDGPTDAAGAVVDGTTWPALRAAGRDPERDLAAHDAYHALDAVGALVRVGMTGTNVMDLVIGIGR
jgi:glycerate-2-kinase